MTASLSLDRDAPPPTSQALVEAAKRWSADLLVLGTHGWRGLQHLVLGSVAEGVVRLAPVPVLLVRLP